MKKRLGVGRSIVYVVMYLYTFVSLYPFVWMLFYSLKNNEEIFVTNPFGFPKEIQWNNYVRAVQKFDMLLYFGNSIYVAVATVAIGIFFALLFTYVISRVRTKPMKALQTLLMAGMFIPIQAIMVPLVVTVRDVGLTNSLWSVIIPYVALSFPFSVMVLYGFYQMIPLDLEESAYIEGAGFMKTYFRNILPQMSSAISVLAIYQVMQSWNEFSLALILITDNDMKTLPLGISTFYSAFATDWGLVGAALVIASAPLIFCYILFSDQISDSITLSGLK